MFPRSLFAALGVAVGCYFLAAGNPAHAQITYKWSTSTSGSAWLGSVNWSIPIGGGNSWGYPGESANATSTNTDIAIFTNYSTAVGSSGVGIDFSTAAANGQFVLGAIQVNASTPASGLFIGNPSTTTNGTLTLNGATISGISNVLIDVRGNQDLTIQNTQGSGNKTMGLRLGITNGIFEVASGRTLTVNSIISQSSAGSRLTIDGGGTVVLGAANTFSGGVTITGGSTLNISTDNRLGATPLTPTSGYLVLDNGTLNMTGGLSLPANRGVAIGPGGGTISTNSNALTINSPITDSGTGGRLNIVGGTGSETITLGGNNSFTGGLTVSDTALSFSNPNSLGAAPASPFASALVFNNVLLNYNGADGSIPSNLGILIGKPSGNSTTEIRVITPTATLSYGGVIGTNGSGTASLNKEFNGTLVLSGANTYNGNTNVSGGLLKLDFSASGAPTANILPTTSKLTLGGTATASHDLTLSGASSVANTQSFVSTSIANGNSVISLASGDGGSVTLNLGTVTVPTTGGAVQFNLPANGTVNTSTGTVNTILRSSNVASAIVGTSDWAAKNASNTSIVAGSSVSGFYTPSTLSTLSGNADVASGVNTTLAAATTTLSSLRFNASESRTIDVGSGNTLITGGILVTPAVDGHVSMITGGNLQGAGADLVVFQNNTSTTGELQIASAIVSGGLTKAGPGVLTLSGANTYSSATTVVGGVLQAGATNSLSPNSTITLVDGAILRLNGLDQNIAGVTNQRDGGSTNPMIIENGAATAATLTLGGNNTSSVFGGLIRDGGSGSLNLIKAGTGIVGLSGPFDAGGGTNTYTGNTLIQAGTLQMFYTGNTSNSPITVGTGTFQSGTTPTLAGTGTILGTVTVKAHGALSPGDPSPPTVGTLTVSNSVTFNPNGQFQLQLAASGSSDKLTVTGNGSVLNFQSSGGTRSLLALDDASGFNPSSAASYTIASISGGAVFQYNGSTIADGTQLAYYEVGVGSSGSIDIDVSAFSGLSNGNAFLLRRSGSNLVLTYSPTSIPEPGSILALAGVSILLPRCLRRRRATKSKSDRGERIHSPIAC